MACTTTDLSESQGNVRDKPLSRIWADGFADFRSGKRRIALRLLRLLAATRTADRAVPPSSSICSTTPTNRAGPSQPPGEKRRCRMKLLLIPVLWLLAAAVAVAVLWRLWRGQNVVLYGRWGRASSAWLP
jgi:hypothetical protein